MIQPFTLWQLPWTLLVIILFSSNRRNTVTTKRGTDHGRLMSSMGLMITTLVDTMPSGLPLWHWMHLLIYLPSRYNFLKLKLIKIRRNYHVLFMNHFKTIQNVTDGNITRPKRLDDFKYIEEPEMTRLFLDELAKLRFHGVSVSTYHVT